MGLGATTPPGCVFGEEGALEASLNGSACTVVACWGLQIGWGRRLLYIYRCMYACASGVKGLLALCCVSMMERVTVLGQCVARMDVRWLRGTDKSDSSMPSSSA
jgi:hypothetical protein